MPLPPVADAPNSMARHHFLVERNRLRVKAYEPTRKAREEEEILLHKRRQEERNKKYDTWQSNSTYGSGLTRSMRMNGGDSLEKPNYYKIVKEEEAQLKAERMASYKSDMQQQLKERRDFLAKWKADEKAYVDALVENHKAKARKMEECDREEALATKLYMDRMRESNLRELEEKRAKQQARENYELSIVRAMQDADEKKAQLEEKRAKDMKSMLQRQNEDYHRNFQRRKEEDTNREKLELRSMMEYNAALAEKERKESQRKRNQFKADFEESISKQAEFSRLHNYDEPMESIKKRNENAMESMRLTKQEERRRVAEGRRQYREELMKQIREKQEWQSAHLDCV